MNPTELLKNIAYIVNNDFNCDGIDCENCPLYLNDDDCLVHSTLKNYHEMTFIKE